MRFVRPSISPDNFSSPTKNSLWRMSSAILSQRTSLRWTNIECCFDFGRSLLEAGEVSCLCKSLLTAWSFLVKRLDGTWSKRHSDKKLKDVCSSYLFVSLSHVQRLTVWNMKKASLSWGALYCSPDLLSRSIKNSFHLHPSCPLFLFWLTKFYFCFLDLRTSYMGDLSTFCTLIHFNFDDE